MNKLKKMRIKRGFTQKSLATLAGVNRVSLAKLERLGVRRVDTARRYAKLLKCNPVDIIDV
jgi:DNA-binding XRE family transcriptional regulator